MGRDLTLRADDGHEFGAYRADPEGPPKGGIVVIQEIFGVNQHIREVADGFAADGYLAVAPALYDRSSRRGVELGYDADDVQEGLKYRGEFSLDEAMADVKAAADLIAGEGLKVGTVGYCWGGTVSYLAGTRLEVQAAVIYYGGQIMPHIGEKGRCPMLMHFGEQDHGIPLTDVHQIDVSHDEATVHIYDADHGFNCDHRSQYNAEAAALARQRTLALFDQLLG